MHIAYGSVAAGLRTAIAQKDNLYRLEKIPSLWLIEASRLLPELMALHPGLPPAPPLDNPGAQSRFFEGLRQVLLSICNPDAKHPGVIFFDDLHWADGASLDLLAYLLRRLREQPLFLILTWRSKRAANDHRLYRLLTEAQRSIHTTVISLSRLNQSTVQELVSHVSPAGTTPPHGPGARFVWDTERLQFYRLQLL